MRCPKWNGKGRHRPDCPACAGSGVVRDTARHLLCSDHLLAGLVETFTAEHLDPQTMRPIAIVHRLTDNGGEGWWSISNESALRNVAARAYRLLRPAPGEPMLLRVRADASGATALFDVGESRRVYAVELDAASLRVSARATA